MATSVALTLLLVAAPFVGYIFGAIALGFESNTIARMRLVLSVIFLITAIATAFIDSFTVLGAAVMLFCLMTFMVSLAENDRKSLFAFRPTFRHDGNGAPYGRTEPTLYDRPKLVIDNPSPRPSPFARKPKLTVIQGGLKEAPKPHHRPAAPSLAGTSSPPVPLRPTPYQPPRHFGVASKVSTATCKPACSNPNIRLAFSNPNPQRTPRSRSHLKSVP